MTPTSIIPTRVSSAAFSTSTASATSSSSSAVAPVATSHHERHFVREGILRRRFLVELNHIGTHITHSGLSDDMTNAIHTWQQNFLTALRTNADEHQVGDTYIALLQQLMRDPITGAPLEEQSVLGSDGRTYGLISLNVYWLSVPGAHHNSSPLDPHHAPFTTTPHPIVAEMTAWLRGHNAFQRSEELQRTYERLLAERRARFNGLIAEERRARIQRIYARATAANRQETQRFREQTNALTRDLDQRLAGMQTQLAQGLHAFQGQTTAFAVQGMQQLDQLAQQDEAQARDVQAQLDRAAENEPQALEAVQERVEQVVVAQRTAWAQSREELDRAIAEEREALNQVPERIQNALQQTLAPVIQGIRAFAEQEVAEMEQIAHEDQARVEQIQVHIAQLEQEVAQLERDNQILTQNTQNVSHQLQRVQQEEIALERSIRDTERAIKEMEKRNKKGFLTTIATIGACCFASWGLQHLASASSGGSMSGVVTPLKGGARISFGVSW